LERAGERRYDGRMSIELSPALREDLSRKGVDIDRTISVIGLLENGAAGSGAPGGAAPRIPGAADARIIDRTSELQLTLVEREARRAFSEFDLPKSLIPEAHGGCVRFGEPELSRIGTLLFPRVAYGVLNGGSATSYIDRKKNRELDAAAFEALKEEFDAAAALSKNAPKGVTPAFVGEDGGMGPSFLQLKMRSLLLRAIDYRKLSGDAASPLLPFFQMTSGGTDAPLREAYRNYACDPLLAPLIEEAGIDPTEPLGAVQPLLAALTHSEEGMPRRVFSKAWGKTDEGLALPGGHGENFRVLAPVYRELKARGIRWAYLGNVDNSGYTVDPVSVALVALKGASAAFEAAWKTPVDVKGGIFAERADGRLSVAEIGQSVDKAAVAAAEAEGKPILFNCATGLFDLDVLVPRLDRIADELPIRVSDQDKEAGRYAQAEQNTWDIVGLLENPLVFAVAKEKRFIAAKMLLETLLTSPCGIKADRAEGIGAGLRDAAARLRSGFASLLRGEYRL